MLPGISGTLTEFILTWNISFLRKFSQKAPLPLFAWRDPWHQVVRSIMPLISIQEDEAAIITWVDGVDDVMPKIADVMRAHKPSN